MCVRVRMCVSIPINHIVACAAGCGGVNAVVAVVVVVVSVCELVLVAWSNSIIRWCAVDVVLWF